MKFNKIVSCLFTLSFLILTSCSGEGSTESPSVQVGESSVMGEVGVGDSKRVQLPSIDNINKIKECEVKIVSSLGDSPRELVVSDELNSSEYSKFAIAYNEIYKSVDTHFNNLYQHIRSYKSNANWLATYEVIVNEFTKDLNKAFLDYEDTGYSNLASFEGLKNLEFPTVEEIVVKENQTEIKGTLKSYLKNLREVGYLPEDLVSSEEYCSFIEGVSEEYGIDPANYGKVFGVDSELYKSLRGL